MLICVIGGLQGQGTLEDRVCHGEDPEEVT